MDKILNVLLSTTWGRSFIGWTCIIFFVFTAAIGWAYMDLFKDYKALELRSAAELERCSWRLEDCWRMRHEDLVNFHHRQDTLEQLNKKRRR